MKASESAGGLEVKGVSKRYGPLTALRDVDVSVERGTILGLLGNNGAGKSTLMNICSGVLSGDSGTVSICGHERSACRSIPSRDLGYAPQDDAVYPTLSVRRNLEYFAELAGMGRGERENRVMVVARDLLLEDLLDMKVRHLSGGQRRRVHLALAVMHDPKVILLDEATVGIDVESRQSVLDYVRGLAARGAAVLYSTHQLHEAEQLDLMLLIVDHGRVVASGRASDVIAQHAFASAEIALSSEPPRDWLAQLVVLAEVRSPDSSLLTASVKLPQGASTVAEVVAALEPEARDLLVSVSLRPPSLEQAFLSLTAGDHGESPPAAARLPPSSPGRE